MSPATSATRARARRPHPCRTPVRGARACRTPAPRLPQAIARTGSTHPGLAEELLVRTGWLVLLTDLVVLTARLLS